MQSASVKSNLAMFGIDYFDAIWITLVIMPQPSQEPVHHQPTRSCDQRLRLIPASICAARSGNRATLQVTRPENGGFMPSDTQRSAK
jgi:hypothetical protein